jgi:hypothetical protein
MKMKKYLLRILPVLTMGLIVVVVAYAANGRSEKAPWQKNPAGEIAGRKAVRNGVVILETHEVNRLLSKVTPEQERIFGKLEAAAIHEVIMQDEYIQEILKPNKSPDFKVDISKLVEINNQARPKAWKKLEELGYIASEMGR